MIEERISVHYLTADTCSIRKQNFYDGQPVGIPLNAGYVNNQVGRTALENEQPAEIVAAVIALWGDTATVPEPVQEV